MRWRWGPNTIIHPLHTDMPNSEGYVKRRESKLITTTGRVFVLDHSQQ
jgi:hypothetical protein